MKLLSVDSGFLLTVCSSGIANKCGCVEALTFTVGLLGKAEPELFLLMGLLGHAGRSFI